MRVLPPHERLMAMRRTAMEGAFRPPFPRACASTGRPHSGRTLPYSTMSKPLRVTPPMPRQAVSWPSLPWPLPALLAWGAGWAAWWVAHAAQAPAALALATGLGLALLLALRCQGARRRIIAAAGFPLSALLLGAGADLPAWTWLLLLLPLLALYPLRAWRDAPFFPTPAAALQGLGDVTGAPRRVLDAGCGLGHGLAELRRQWPQAELHGVEWSPLLAALAALRARAAGLRACVRRGDMWAQPWGGHDLVYLFQRPESMARAWNKARAELVPGAWLVSLEFAVPDVTPVACLQGPGRRTVWVYRLGGGSEDSIHGPAGR